MKRIKITDATVNGRGFRILTNGVSLKRYSKNPVLLWMHQRGTVIGQMRDIKVEEDAITAEPWFDEVTELSRQIKAQYEAGSVRACSIGVDVIEVAGQQDLGGNDIPVVTKSEIFEVSLVDVPENPATVTLRHQGKDILPQQLIHLAKQQPTIKNQKTMNLQELILLLALGEGATEDDVRKALVKQKNDLQEARQQLALVQKNLDDINKQRQQEQLAHVQKHVENAILQQRITADRKQHYIDLGKKIGPDALQDIFDDMPKPKRIVEQLHKQNHDGNKEYKKLSDVPESELLTLRKEDPARYQQLYQAEYGIKMQSQQDSQ